MSEAFIYEAVRTPVGRRDGGLAELHPADLAAAAIADLLSRSQIDPTLVDDVILGCIDQIGSQSGNIARTAWLAAGFPEHVPGVTVDRQCGSSQQAVHFAAQAVLSGTQDLVVAGGVQSMSQIPMQAAVRAGEPYGSGDPLAGSTGWRARYGDQEISQFRGADLIAEHWSITREQMEDFAAESHQRAAAAIAEGRFAEELVGGLPISVDEGPRAVDRQKMASLAPLRDGGRTTAAMASQISDGAAALLIGTAEIGVTLGLRPLARIHSLVVRGGDPVMMLTAPIEATREVLDRARLGLDQIDLFEVNEAFSSVALAWVAETGADPARLNVNGGAIALGHPIGASGARLLTTLVHELERRDGRFGLQTMCEGGGVANALIVERLR